MADLDQRRHAASLEPRRERDLLYRARQQADGRGRAWRVWLRGGDAARPVRDAYQSRERILLRCLPRREGIPDQLHERRVKSPNHARPELDGGAEEMTSACSSVRRTLLPRPSCFWQVRDG